MKRENTGGDQQPRITLDIVNAEGRPCPVELILDTGFSGYLTLPIENIRQLGLSPLGRRILELDGGTLLESEAYLAAVSLQGHLTDVLVLRSDSAPLLGMSLLSRNRVTLHAVAGEGDINIQKLQAGAPEKKLNASIAKLFLGRLWWSVKEPLFRAAFVVAILSMIVAFASGVFSLPLNFGEILTFLGIWVTLGALLGQNKPPDMPLGQYLPRRWIGFVCVYGLFAAVAIIYAARVARESEVITGAEFWGMIVLSLAGFAVGFFAGQDKENKW